MEWTKRLNQVVGRLPSAGALEVLHWAYDSALSDNVPHRHTFFEVCQVGSHGRGEFRVQNQVHHIAPGDIFIARPGVVHQIVNCARQKMELSWVSYGWIPSAQSSGEQAENDIAMRHFADSSVVIAPDNDQRIASIWRALRVIGEGDAAVGQNAQLRALAIALVLAIAQIGAGAPIASDRVLETNDLDLVARLATRYIHDNLNRRLSVEEIAAQVHFSPRHLTRLMQKFAGVSPAAYIERARMDRAHSLLLHSGAQLKEIAREVGYVDVHHFTRVCKRVWGKPPGLLRLEEVHCEPQKRARCRKSTKDGRVDLKQ